MNVDDSLRSTHFSDDGDARMVDVSAKQVTVRRAVAEARVRMNVATARMIKQHAADKGDVLGVARLAAISASKVTSQLIPLCHAIPIEAVTVDFRWLADPPDDNTNNDDDSPPSGADERSADHQNAEPSSILRCQVTVKTSGKTGVEIEAITAASVAAITVYDMVKSVDRGIVIGPIQLVEKVGGKSGHYRRGDQEK